MLLLKAMTLLEHGMRLVGRAFKVSTSAWTSVAAGAHCGSDMVTAPELLRNVLTAGAGAACTHDVNARKKANDSFFNSVTYTFGVTSKLRDAVDDLTTVPGKPSPLRCWRIAAR